MARFTNMQTGEKYMTEMNSLRHAIAEGNKAIKANNYNKMRSIWNKFNNCYYSDMCCCCQEDDFGYCGLRNGQITEEEKFKKCCFPAFMKYITIELKTKGGTI